MRKGLINNSPPPPPPPPPRRYIWAIGMTNLKFGYLSISSHRIEHSVIYQLWRNMKMTVVQFLHVWTPPPRLCRSVLLSNRLAPAYGHLGYLCWLVLCYTNNKDTFGSRLHIPAVGHLHCAEVLDSTAPLIHWTVVWKLVSLKVQCWALRKSKD